MECDKCHGKGWTRYYFDFMETSHYIKQWCSECKGTGKVEIELEDRSGIEWEIE